MRSGAIQALILLVIIYEIAFLLEYQQQGRVSRRMGAGKGTGSSSSITALEWIPRLRPRRKTVAPASWPCFPVEGMEVRRAARPFPCCSHALTRNHTRECQYSSSLRLRGGGAGRAKPKQPDSAVSSAKPMPKATGGRKSTPKAGIGGGRGGRGGRGGGGSKMANEKKIDGVGHRCNESSVTSKNGRGTGGSGQKSNARSYGGGGRGRGRRRGGASISRASTGRNASTTNHTGSSTKLSRIVSTTTSGRGGRRSGSRSSPSTSTITPTTNNSRPIRQPTNSSSGGHAVSAKAAIAPIRSSLSAPKELSNNEATSSQRKGHSKVNLASRKQAASSPKVDGKSQGGGQHQCATKAGDGGGRRSKKNNATTAPAVSSVNKKKDMGSERAKQQQPESLSSPLVRTNHSLQELQQLWAPYSDEVHAAELLFVSSIASMNASYVASCRRRVRGPLLPPPDNSSSPHSSRRAPRRVVASRTKRKEKRKTLVLDLDETLVHSAFDVLEVGKPDLKFGIEIKRHLHIIYVKLRPGARRFLERMSKLFEVVVFTSAQKLYADRVLNFLDPNNSSISHRLYRSSCVLLQGNYIKDLQVLGRPLSQTILVDNAIRAFAFQLTNGVPIDSFYGNVTDDELSRLEPFLGFLSDPRVTDVREWIEARFNLNVLLTRLPRLVSSSAAKPFNETFSYTNSDSEA